MPAAPGYVVGFEASNKTGGTAAPVAWWTWVGRALPDEAEAGGGLMVAVIQLAITLSASLGGIMFDTQGY